MNTATIIAASTSGVAFLIAALSIPLILRKVPMNHFYGVRFRASFQSERNWYEINEFGGKVLFLASLPILLCGLYGFIFPPSNEDVYLWTDFAVTILSVGGALILSLKKAKDVEHEKA